MAPVGKSLKHRTMASAAAEEIRNRILSGGYPPGVQLRQDGLAADLGMSRIPIREALVQLESEGLLKIVPHRGAIVAQLTVDEIEELFNMRLLLEPFLFKRSAPHLTGESPGLSASSRRWPAGSAPASASVASGAATRAHRGRAPARRAARLDPVDALRQE